MTLDEIYKFYFSSYARIYCKHRLASYSFIMSNIKTIANLMLSRAQVSMHFWVKLTLKRVEYIKKSYTLNSFMRLTL